MHILRPYIERIEGLTTFAGQATENPVTQGVMLDVNPVWLACYRLFRAGLNPYFWLGQRNWNIYPSMNFIDLTFIEGDAINFEWRDDHGVVGNVCRYAFNFKQKEHDVPDSVLPFLIKVIARPVPAELFEQRNRLQELSSRQPFLTMLETRPLGRLAVAPGDKCFGNNIPGTIGGFLRDHNGAVYATTCGHVAALGSIVTVSGNVLGVCSHSRPPTPMVAGQLCTRNCSWANELDLALVPVSSAPFKNSASGTASEIASHQNILLRGAITSGNFEVGGTGLTYSPGNSNVCFKNVFEVRPKTAGGIIAPAIRNAFATIPTQGDSGGWLETAGGKWCGTLVAADTVMGYALEADDTLREANASFGMQLQLA